MLLNSSAQMGFHKSVMGLDLEHLLLLPPGDGGMRKDLGDLILPLFSTSSFSNTALFGKQGGSWAALHLFPKLVGFFPRTQTSAFAVIKHRSDSHSMTTENTLVCTAEKIIKNRKCSSWHCWKMNVQGEKKRSQWDSERNIYICGGWAVLWWGGLTCHGPVVGHCDINPELGLIHYFFSLEMCSISPCPISSFCPQGVLSWGKISPSPTRCSECFWVFSCQILGFVISIPKDQQLPALGTCLELFNI